MGPKKVQEHVPSAKKPLLVNAGEESGKVLIVHLKMAMFRSLSKDRQEMVYITSDKVVRAGNGEELEDHAGQNVEHGSEGCVHKGDDGATTLVVLLLLGQNVASRELTALTNSPWIG